jgi:ketosteroid isomerase-like protein
MQKKIERHHALWHPDCGYSAYSNKERGTMNLSTATVVVAAFVAFGMLPGTSEAMSDDEAKIETLENLFVAAFNAKDVDAIMKVYVPEASLVVFEVVPPRQHLGADAYRKDWQDFFAMLKGPVKFWITDLHVETADTLGYSHSIQHVSGPTRKANRSSWLCGSPMAIAKWMATG